MISELRCNEFEGLNGKTDYFRRPETSSRGRVLPLDLRAYNIEAVPEDAWDNSEICVCEHKTKKELDRQLIR